MSKNFWSWHARPGLLAFAFGVFVVLELWRATEAAAYGETGSVAYHMCFAGVDLVFGFVWALLPE